MQRRIVVAFQMSRRGEPFVARRAIVRLGTASLVRLPVGRLFVVGVERKRWAHSLGGRGGRWELGRTGWQMADRAHVGRKRLGCSQTGILSVLRHLMRLMAVVGRLDRGRNGVLTFDHQRIEGAVHRRL